MKILIFGLGSIGRRHAQILQKYFAHELYCFRSGSGSSGNDLGIPELTSWDEVAALQIDVAFICNPTHLHVETALRCARFGMHLFIEKPLSDSYESVDELEALCQEKNLHSYVAYCLRFHPVILRLKEILVGKDVYHARVVCTSLLSRWRPQQAHKNYSAYAAQGGGVILDLSHEFDYVEFIFGAMDAISGRHGRRSTVTVDADDFCDAQVTLKNGTPVLVHINFLSLNQERTISVDTSAGFYQADLIANRIVKRTQQGEEVETFVVEREDFMRAQTAYFFGQLIELLKINQNSRSPTLVDESEWRSRVGQAKLNNGASMMNHIGEAKLLLKRLVGLRNG